jgi:hypothetical protein
MHKRRDRSDRGKSRPERVGSVRNAPKIRHAWAGEGRPQSYPILNTDTFERGVRRIGDNKTLASAASNIGCTHGTLSRLTRGEQRYISHPLLVKVLDAAAKKGDDIVDLIHASVLMPAAQRRLDRYHETQRKALAQHDAAGWRMRFTVRPLELRYPEIFKVLYDGLKSQPVLPDHDSKDLILYRMLSRLFEGMETGWMDVGYKDFLVKDNRGESHEDLLKKFLVNAIENELILLKVRGAEQIRANRLALAAEAHVAAVRYGAEKSPQADAARSHRVEVYQEQRIPDSYLLGD